MKTLKEVLTLAADYLKQRKVAQARLAAETLLARLLQLQRIELYLYFDRPLEEAELVVFRHYLKRASQHEPIAYILGEVEFYHTTLRVTPDVLIPRQETELLLDRVCKSLEGNEKRALDLCCGSGCLAIGLKKAHPHLDVVGVDVSEAALKVARSNAERNQAPVTFIQSDLVKELRTQKFDLILCNPPYIKTDDYLNLEPSVKNFEPKMALVAGSSGYEFFERLKEELPQVTTSGAKVFFEIASGQGEGVKALFSSPSWGSARVEHDWAGHERFFFLIST